MDTSYRPDGGDGVGVGWTPLVVWVQVCSWSGLVGDRRVLESSPSSSSWATVRDGSRVEGSEGTSGRDQRCLFLKEVLVTCENWRSW